MRRVGSLRGFRLQPAMDLGMLAAAVLLASCDAVKLQAFLQDPGTSFQVTRTFGELISTGPVQVAHYLEVQLTPATTPVFVPTTGEIVFDDSFDGLTNCVVIKPKLRDKDKATPLAKLGPGLAEAEHLRIALCNLDNSGSPSPLNAAIQALYMQAGDSDPAGKATRFFDMALAEKDRRGNVWAAPEAVFPDPPAGSKLKPWSRLGQAGGGKLQIVVFHMKDDHPVYLNPVPYLAKIPLSPGPTVLQPPTIAEIKIETATDANFTAGLKSYNVDLGTGVLTPNEPLDGFVRVFFRLNDSGTAPVVAPHEISSELRQVGVGGVRSSAFFLVNSLPTSPAVVLTTISQTVGNALYRTAGAPGTVSDPATNILWLQLPFDPALHNPASVPSYDISALSRDDFIEVDAMDGAQPRFPLGDYELEIVLASGFGAAASDSKVVKFPLAGPVPPVTVTIANPIDTDGDTNIDDNATAANNLTGNEFTFSATAPPTPGVLTIPVRVDLAPDNATTRVVFAGRVRTKISPINDSHGPAANVQMGWTTPFPGDPKAGSAVYNPGTTHWETQVAFTNLPPNNTDFGQKTVTVEVLDSSNTVLQTRTVNIEVFWPLLVVPGGARNDANFAKNHPGGAALSAPLTHTRNGAPAGNRAPNWFFYWRQVVAGARQSLWDHGDTSLFGKMPAGVFFNRLAPKGPYASPYQDIIVHEHAQAIDVTGGTTTGIDAFVDTITHENFHWSSQLVLFTNMAFGLGITGATNVASNHWSATIDKPLVLPVPPLPAGRTYNHFVDLNADGDFADPGEDLDLDGDDIHNASDGPGVSVESMANASEGNVEHGLAAQDWGNPGKQHATLNVHTD